MKVIVKKWGNSASVRIPASVMEAAHLSLDQPVDVREEAGRIVIEPVREEEFDLAELVAQAEIGRAQAEAARREYAEAGTTDVEISTAEDDKVCPVCDAAAKAGAHPLGSPPLVPLHPGCRCAELPVLAGA